MFLILLFKRFFFDSSHFIGHIFIRSNCIMSDFLSCRPSPLWLRVKKRALKTKEHSPEEIMQSLTQLSTLTYSSWRHNFVFHVLQTLPEMQETTHLIFLSYILTLWLCPRGNGCGVGLHVWDEDKVKVRWLFFVCFCELSLQGQRKWK